MSLAILPDELIADILHRAHVHPDALGGYGSEQGRIAMRYLERELVQCFPYAIRFLTYNGTRTGGRDFELYRQWLRPRLGALLSLIHTIRMRSKEEYPVDEYLFPQKERIMRCEQVKRPRTGDLSLDTYLIVGEKASFNLIIGGDHGGGDDPTVVLCEITVTVLPDAIQNASDDNVDGMAWGHPYINAEDAVDVAIDIPVVTSSEVIFVTPTLQEKLDSNGHQVFFDIVVDFYPKFIDDQFLEIPAVANYMQRRIDALTPPPPRKSYRFDAYGS